MVNYVTQYSTGCVMLGFDSQLSDDIDMNVESYVLYIVYSATKPNITKPNVT